MARNEKNMQKDKNQNAQDLNTNQKNKKNSSEEYQSKQNKK